ncbi:MAG: NUDIX domain-containing protein [Vannielia sp.]|uniref:NUDIX hydrolase n=1 Tax=Vannielia sp. TaxID=2813045 RepID=UPI003B8D58CB
MTIWRPLPRIRVLAIGLAWRGTALLAAEVRDDAGRLKGVRPPGGGVEFGESWQVALRREWAEEFGLEIAIAGPPVALENIYTHEGEQGHEVVFAAPVTLPPGPHMTANTIEAREDNGLLFTARWVEFATLDTTGPALFPAGLKPLIHPPA